MDEPDPSVQSEKPSANLDEPSHAQATLARGSGHLDTVTRLPSVPEDSVMQLLPEAKAARIAEMRRELADLQRQLIEAQQRVAIELQGRAEDAERFESVEARVVELEAQLASERTQLARAASAGETRTAELETELASVRMQLEAATAAAAQLVAVSAERDMLKSQLDATRERARHVASQLARFGEQLVDGGRVAEVAVPEVEPASTLEPTKPSSEAAPESSAAPPVASSAEPRPVRATERPVPPPLPRSRTAAHSAEVETVFEVIEAPRPSRLRTALLLVLGVGIGCAATIVIVKATGSSSTPSPVHDLGAAASSAPSPPADREPSPESVVAPSVASVVMDASVITPAIVEPDTNDNPVVPTPGVVEETAKTGVILLPASAGGHRLFVDGTVVRVKDSRAEVPCGSREVRIGSRGTLRTIDVACGGETAVVEQ